MQRRMVVVWSVVAILAFARFASGEDNFSTYSRDPASGAYANFFLHRESRQTTGDQRYSESNVDFFIGFDHQVDSTENLHLGLRAGIFRERSLTAAPPILPDIENRLFVGAQAYKYFDLAGLAGLKFGPVVDFVFGGSAYPVGLYTGATAGFRVGIIHNIYAELPVEIGIFPFFDGTPMLIKAGLQAGIRF